MIDIQLLTSPISAEQCTAWASSEESGGIVTFVGTVRNHTKGKRVLRLEYEAYEPMALAEMEKIARRVLAEFPVQKMAIHHRTGLLGIGEAAVVVAVGAAHRQAAFVACQFAIDTLKETVPIWKKEFFEDGEVWVAAHP